MSVWSVSEISFCWGACFFQLCLETNFNCNTMLLVNVPTAACRHRTHARPYLHRLERAVHLHYDICRSKADSNQCHTESCAGHEVHWYQIRYLQPVIISYRLFVEVRVRTKGWSVSTRELVSFACVDSASFSLHSSPISSLFSLSNSLHCSVRQADLYEKTHTHTHTEERSSQRSSLQL